MSILPRQSPKPRPKSSQNWLQRAIFAWIRLPLGLTGAIALFFVLWAIVLASASPAQFSPPASTPISVPISVQVNPINPQLGDTISVMIANSGMTPPSVTAAGQNYPAFPLASDRYRALIPTTPLDPPGQLSLQINVGTASQTSNLTLRNRKFPTQSIWLPAGQDGNVSDAEYDRVDAIKRIVTPEKFWNGKFLRPNNGAITSTYGIRRYYNGEFAEDYYHRGVDYAGNTGSPIIAPAAGRITLVGYEQDGFAVHGNCIGMDHGQGVSSIFIHLQRIDVKPGEFVQAGQQIGTLGSTGAATGPHLHWGLYVNGKSVDPVPWREAGFD
jgi:murein DD-endopeptidase MepM/ murein hydrolase activator NlpD